MSAEAPTLERLRGGGKAALAAALAALERRPDAPGSAALLDAAHAAPLGHVLGITGPPGVGKSTLVSALINAWRARGLRVAVIAVDPSSRRTGGALLGDRTRIVTDPGDEGVFIRSMAARDRLGGLAGLTVAAMVVMRALYDVVIVETVGVGQSETDVVTVADTVLFCVQPGSGDSLQFMKAGIAEIPHLIAVTKADMGGAAERARADVAGALSLAEAGAAEDWTVRVLSVSAARRAGIDELVEAVADHWRYLAGQERLRAQRHRQAESWLEEAVRERFGSHGLARAGDLSLRPGQSPFARLAEVAARLAR